jgi:hypothetical protein
MTYRLTSSSLKPQLPVLIGKKVEKFCSLPCSLFIGENSRRQIAQLHNANAQLRNKTNQYGTQVPVNYRQLCIGVSKQRCPLSLHICSKV